MFFQWTGNSKNVKYKQNKPMHYFISKNCYVFTMHNQSASVQHLCLKVIKNTVQPMRIIYNNFFAHLDGLVLISNTSISHDFFQLLCCTFPVSYTDWEHSLVFKNYLLQPFYLFIVSYADQEQNSESTPFPQQLFSVSLGPYSYQK